MTDNFSSLPLLNFLDPIFTQSVETLALYLAYYGFFILIERIVPAERQPWRNMLFNLCYMPFYIVATALFLPLTTALIVGNLRLHHADWFGFFPIQNILGNVLSGIAYLLIIDFCYYWFHRGQHGLSIFWSQHKLHHSETSLNVTTVTRIHWLEEPLRVLLITLPMAMLFDLTPSYSAGVAFLLSFWGFFIHANLGIHFGSLNRIICTSQVHRIHHSNRPAELNKNFAAYFPIYDICFGTYASPTAGDHPTTGLASGERVSTIWRANCLPFIDWIRMFKHKIILD